MVNIEDMGIDDEDLETVRDLLEKRCCDRCGICYYNGTSVCDDCNSAWGLDEDACEQIAVELTKAVRKMINEQNRSAEQSQTDC